MLNDLQFAIRQAARQPDLAIGVVLSLALGLGVNATLFSIADAALLRQPPAAHPEQLVRLYLNHHSPLTYPDYRFFKERSRSFSHVFVEDPRMVAFSENGAETERIMASVVSGDFWRAMAVRPAAGQFFHRDRDDVPGPVPEAVVSYNFWRNRLGADPALVGRTLRLNAGVFQVVGVAPEGFTSSLTLFAPQVWVSLSDTPALLGAGPSILSGSLYASARLKEGISRQAANAEVGVLRHSLAATDTAAYANVTFRVDHARGMNAEMRAPLLAASGGLLLVAFLVLAVACANVGNLLLSRAAARQREFGIRVAVGAGRGRLVRQLLVECGFLASVAAALALVASAWTSGAINRFLPEDAEGLVLTTSLDAATVVFSLGLVVVTVLMAGLAPALQSTGGNVVTAIRGTGMLGGARHSRTRRTFLFVQVAFSTLLLTIAAFFLRSLANAGSIDPGYPVAGLANIRVDLASRNVPTERSGLIWRELLNEAASFPGVTAATAIQTVPLTGSKTELGFVRQGGEGQSASRFESTQFAPVAPGYFATVGIPLLRGRPFSSSDGVKAPRVGIVNEAMALHLAPDGNALGQRISTDGPAGPWIEIVGVARNIRYNSLGEVPPSFLYVPMEQAEASGMTYQVRLAPGASLSALREAAVAAVRRADPSLAPPVVRMLEDAQQIVLLPARLAAGALQAVGALALLLAGVGMFGVAGYAVTQRTKEIGVRRALGADGRTILRDVLGGTARTLAAGATVGLVLALVVRQLLAAQLYGVGALEPLAMLGVPLLLAAVALAAALVPARRALRVNPADALRAE